MTRRNDFVWDQQRDDHLRQLYAEGRSWATIGKAFGVSRGAVQRRGKRLGLAARATAEKAAQQHPEPATGHVLPNPAAPVNSRAARRSEGGHPLAAGNALTWALVLAGSPTLGDVPWPG
jgi:hypothetical protein